MPVLDAITRWPRALPLAASVSLHAAARRGLLGLPGGVRVLDRFDAGLLTPPASGHRFFGVSYEGGREIEPAVGSASPGDRAWPIAFAADAESAWRFEDDEAAPIGLPPALGPAAPGPIELGEPASFTGRDAFCRAVERAIAYVHAGDVYQVNLTHRLSMPFVGEPRDLFAALAREAEPAHGFYVELPSGAAVCSVSPELFLRHDAASRAISTEPMKGTRPATGDAAELFGAAKDRAELAMIVDLMRNDLGRTAAFGSVCVDVPRKVELHGNAVHQATATISAKLRDELLFGDALVAAFPPGSVTGAPKIRAMQIIDELEPVRRHLYCGTLGVIDASGDASCSVAIRTALVSPPNAEGVRTVDYHVGCGIVADSDPEAEWQESLDKAEVLRRVVQRSRAKVMA
ncbi:MAG: anthranilate synthase component I family protein [Planctomycetota bacterium]